MELVQPRLGPDGELIREPIRNKLQFYQLWSQGLLGNRPKTWETLEDALVSKFAKPMAIRYTGTNGGGPFITDLLLNQLTDAIVRLEEEGWLRSQFRFYEQVCPETNRYLINGEISYGDRCLELFFSVANLLMRPALRQAGHMVSGAGARKVLTECLHLEDLCDLLELLDAYPGHVIEFSGFERPVGIDQRHMIIWEVRKY